MLPSVKRDHIPISHNDKFSLDIKVDDNNTTKMLFYVHLNVIWLNFVHIRVVLRLSTVYSGSTFRSLGVSANHSYIIEYWRYKTCKASYRELTHYKNLSGWWIQYLIYHFGMIFFSISIWNFAILTQHTHKKKQKAQQTHTISENQTRDLSISLICYLW